MKAVSLEQIRSILSEHQALLESEYAAVRIGVFGSWARNEARQDSDIDILVEFDKAPGYFKFLELEEQLAEWLGHPVDLVTRRALKPRIGRRILREVIMV